MFNTTRTSRSLNRIAKIAITTAVAAIGLLATSGSAQAAGWQYADLNADGRYDVAVWDINADNIYEYIYADTDHNTSWDLYMYSTGNWTQLKALATGAQVWVYKDVAANWLYVDANANGYYETLGYDTNRDGRSEYVLVDNNGDGTYDGDWITVPTVTPTTWTPYGQAVRTAIDIWMTASNNRMIDVWLD